jgi:hypothetical protein
MILARSAQPIKQHLVQPDINRTPSHNSASKACEEIADCAFISEGSSADPKPINHKEEAARYTNNLLLHLGVSDTPAVLSIIANYGMLPASFNPALTVFNSLNAATGVAAIAADIRETAGTLRNPNATKTDKVMDVVHLVGGDVVSTAASLLPLVASMNTPLAQGVFIGGQLLGIGLDVAKTAYDFSRKGQQSAH